MKICGVEILKDKSKNIKIDETLERLLNESTGIADNITLLTDKILKIVTEIVNSKPRYNDNIIPNATYNETTLNIKLSETYSVPLKLTLFYFRNENEYKQCRYKDYCHQAYYEHKFKRVIIRNEVIGNCLDYQYLAGTIQHELLHAYNNYMKFKKNPKTQIEKEKQRTKIYRKNYKRYAQASQNIGNQNETTRAVSTAITLLTNNEISAYTNGLYKRLFISFINNANTDYKATLHTDPLYRAYLRLNSFVKKLDNGEVLDLENTAQLFNTTEKHLEKLCHEALRKTEKGMAYAVQKAVLDFNNEFYRSVDNHRNINYL